MATHRISKVSVPGWDKDFESETEAREELLRHICKDCRTGEMKYIGEGGTTETMQEPAPDLDNIYDLLATPCGLEFEYESPSDTCSAEKS